MNVVNIAETTNQTPNEVFNLYTSAYPDLRNALFDAFPSLLVFDADTILTLLSEALSSYSGPLEQDAFTEWAGAFVLARALQFAQAVEIIDKSSKVIRFAVSRYMPAFAADNAVDADDLISEVNALVFRYADSLSRRGTAKLETRVTALVRRHCWQHLKKRKSRLEIVQKHSQELDSAGVEVLSEAELASMRFDALESSGPYARTETM